MIPVSKQWLALCQPGIPPLDSVRSSIVALQQESFWPTCSRRSSVAEQLIRNQQVRGSSPRVGSYYVNGLWYAIYRHTRVPDHRLLHLFITVALPALPGGGIRDQGL